MARRYTIRDPQAYAEVRRKAALKRWAASDPEMRRQVTRPAIDTRLANQRQRRESAA